MAKREASGTFALVLAGLAFAFTAYLAMWNTNQHPGNSCDAYSRSYHAENCRAESEDKNLMLGSGAVAVGLLVFGLVRRYQPGGRDPDESAATD